jgi:hypothetical protein
VSALVWNFDPAAGGPRWRCFVPETPFELCVYETGEWFVFDNAKYESRAKGQAPSLKVGKQRAFAAYKLVKKLHTIEQRI